MNSLSRLSSSVKSGYDVVRKYTQTLALAILLGGSVVTESCQQPEPTPSSKPSTPSLKPYNSILVDDSRIGRFECYVDPQQTLLPKKMYLKLNTTDGIIEGKLRKTINTYFPLAVEKHGGGFSTVQEFLDFADSNPNLLVCGGAIGVRSIEKIPGNSGGGIFPVANFNTLSKGLELNLLQILENYNNKLISEGKVGFLIETINPTTNEKILSTKSAARVLLQFYITEGVNGDKMFFNIYFNPNSIQLEFVDDPDQIDLPFTIQP